MKLIMKAHDIADGMTVTKPTGKNTYKFVKNSGVPLFTADGKRLNLETGQYLLVSMSGINVIGGDTELALPFDNAQEIIDYLQRTRDEEDSQ